MGPAAALVIALVVGAATAPAGESAAGLLRAAIERFSMAEFEAALELLRRAEPKAQTVALRARILSQRGVIQDAMGARVEAALTFVRAIAIHPGAELDRTRVRTSTLQLFDCSRRLASTGWGVHQMRASLTAADNGARWRCPEVPELPKLAPEPEPPVLVEAPGAADQDDIDAVAFRWSMIAGGAALAATGLALDLGLDSGRDQKLDPIDFLGATLMVVGVVNVGIGALVTP